MKQRLDTVSGQKAEHDNMTAGHQKRLLICGLLLLPLASSLPAQDLVEETCASLMQEFEDARLAWQVGRDVEATRNGYEDLWIQAVALSDNGGRAQLLDALGAERARFRLQLGETDAARDIAARTQELLDAPLSPAWTDLQSELRSEAAVAEEHPGLAQDPQLADSVESYVREHFGECSERLAEEVDNAVAIGDLAYLEDLGLRATPQLARRVLSRMDETYLTDAVDPLHLLLSLDRIGATQLVRDHLNLGGTTWKLRVFSALDHVNPFQGGKWREVDDIRTPPLSLYPDWMTICAQLLGETQLALRVLDHLEPVISRDALSPELQDALTRLVDGKDVELALAVIRALHLKYVLSSAKPILEAAVDHPSEAVRRAAAELLTRYRSSSALQQRVQDQDAEVRRWLATSLGSRTRYYSRFTDRATTTTAQTIEASLNEVERKILSTLCQDSDASVRRVAARALMQLDAPLDDQVYQRLVQDPDSQVRAHLAHLRHPNTQLATRILVQLSASSDPIVLRSVERELVDGEWAQDSARLLAGFRARMDNPSARPLYQELDWDLGDWYQFLGQQITATRAGTIDLLRLGIERNDWSLMDIAVDDIRNQDQTFGYGSRDYISAVLELSPRELSTLFLATYADGHESDRDTVEEVFADHAGRLAPALALVVAQRDAPRMTRLLALGHLAESGSELATQAIFEMAHDPSWKSVPYSNEEYYQLASLRVAGAAHNALVMRILQDPDIPEAVQRTLASDYDTIGELAQEIRALVLSRWLNQDSGYFSVVAKAIAHLGSDPGQEIDPQLLLRAANNINYAKVAIRAMGMQRLPAYLPKLGSFLRGESMTRNSREAQQIQIEAARALARYLSDDAAQVLLEGMIFLDQDPQGEYFKVSSAVRRSLEAIRLYQEEQERWSAKRESLSDRDDALAELFTLLDSSNVEVRAAAVRGLATFAAIEALPRIIRMLEDDSQVVRLAAQEALTTLDELARQAK